MSNKFQIFVSSTYMDLTEQRDSVIKGVLEMGHIPVGMEMFSAADEEQWNIIKRQIDQSDYYVVIIANRYGSVTDEGISYTEKEYDYAVSQGIPTLGFVLDEDSPWPSKFTDTSPEEVSSLNNFKAKVKQKHISFWGNTEDLYGKCSISLMKAFTAYPREGWVRASQVTDTKMTEELTRLSSENAKLRAQLKDEEATAIKQQREERKKNIRILMGNNRRVYVWKREATDWEEVESRKLFDIFLTLAPELMIEKNIKDMSFYAAQMFSGVEVGTLRDEYPLPSNSVKAWMADFSTLGLVKPSNKKKPVSDKGEYWTLTPKGSDLLNKARLVTLEEGVKKESPPKSDEDIDTK